jgi:GntR family transcriptional regulator of vanillate catabolism
LREGVAGIFREDEHMLESQQRAIDAHPDHQFYNLNIDAGAMWARRLIDRHDRRRGRRHGAPGDPAAASAMTALTAAMVRSTADAADDGAGSQTVRAQLRLRELILGGELAPGARIAELALVERLGVSRTPIRAALVRLQEEGLLEACPRAASRCASSPRPTSTTRSSCAARWKAWRRGWPPSAACTVACWPAARLHRPHRRTAGGARNSATARFVGLRRAQRALPRPARRHAAGSTLVRRQIERVATLPFASPNGFVMADSLGPLARDRLLLAHDQHRALVDAIERREGARAEALAREHARNAQRNLADALNNRRALQRLPGAGLIRPQP